jgi:hypothetical protein
MQRPQPRDLNPQAVITVVSGSLSTLICRAWRARILPRSEMNFRSRTVFLYSM